jgi:hypothetical protein
MKLNIEWTQDNADEKTIDHLTSEVGKVFGAGVDFLELSRGKLRTKVKVTVDTALRLREVEDFAHAVGDKLRREFKTFDVRKLTFTPSFAINLPGAED